MKKYQKPLIAISLLLIGGPLLGRFISSLQVQKIDEELIPLDKAPIVSNKIELTPEQELLAASIKSKENEFNDQISKLESVVLEQVQRCFAIAVEEQVLQSTAQEPEMSTQQFLVAQLNLLLERSKEETKDKKDQKGKSKAETEKEKTQENSKHLKPFYVSDSPACIGLDQNMNLLVAISAYKYNQKGDGGSLLIEGLNIPASKLLQPVAGNIREVGIQNIKESYLAFSEVRAKWESSHQKSWESGGE